MIRDIHTVAIALGNVAYHAAVLTYHAGVGVAYLVDAGVKAAGNAWGEEAEAKPSPFQTGVSGDGTPFVQWLAECGEFEESFWGNPYENVFTHLYIASILNGNLLVTRQTVAAECIWRPDQFTGEPPEREDIEFDGEEVTLKIDIPIAEVKRFTRELRSVARLNSTDLATYRAGRLRFTEHHLIRIETTDGRTLLFGDCQMSDDVSKHVVYDLARSFVGWRGKPQIRNGAPEADYRPI